MRLKYRLMKAYREFIFRLSASENPLFLAYCRYIYKPEPHSIREYIDRYSRSRKEVTFIQVGANDGFLHDPLHYFIKRDNWRGVQLEPQPDVYRNYLVRLHAARPAIEAINAALDRYDGTRTFYRLAISNERWANGLSGFRREVLEKKIEEGTMMKHIRRQGVELPENRDDYIVSEEVATISPGTLLSRFEGKTPDLLAIDTEGYDYEILKIIDLDRITPEVIIYEEALFDEETARECREYVEAHGYNYRSYGRDALAVKRSMVC